MYIERATTVNIAKLEGKYCPVAILRRYIEAANLDLSSNLPLFRPLTQTKSGYSIRNAKLSYTRCREIFKTTLKDLGYDPKDYGLHSLRSGGATAVITNNDSKAVSERLLKLHGRFNSFFPAIVTSRSLIMRWSAAPEHSQLHSIDTRYHTTLPSSELLLRMFPCFRFLLSSSAHDRGSLNTHVFNTHDAMDSSCRELVV